MHRAGVLPEISHIDSKEMFEALAFDKKQIGESLQWILLEDIGKPLVRQDISTSTIKKTLEEFLEK